jgi:hypothetical protein
VPARDLEQHAAERRADRGGGVGHDGQERQAEPALLRREDQCGQRQRQRGEHPGAEALERPEGDQLLDRAGDPAQERAEREDREPDQEEALAPELVGEPPHRDQHDREDDVVRVQHPRHRVHGRVELLGERGDRDVHDRDVDQGHEQADHGHCPDPPLAGVELLRRRVDALGHSRSRSRG